MEEKILKFFYDKFPGPYIVSFTGLRIMVIGIWETGSKKPTKMQNMYKS